MTDDRQDLGDFDYVVIGAGTAGCLLANRLSADPGNRVALLEAGGRDNWHWIHIPVGYLYTMGNPRTDWQFKTAEEPGLNGRSLNYPRGRVLGGCSSINGMIYMRGQARDYDQWRQMGNPGWGWDDVLPLFKKSEDHVAGANDMHGAGGEWRVEEMRLRWEILEAFAEAAIETGIPRSADFNTGTNEGVGNFQVNQRRGVRWNTSKAFLKPAEGRGNLTVFTHAEAERLTLEGKRVTGVDLRLKGVSSHIRARREVVLAAGSIGSPQLLQLSGIGPGDLLRGFDIPVRHEMAGVGENLQDHLQLRTIFRVEGTRTLNERANSLIGKVGMGLEYLLFRRGPLTMAPSQLGIFTRSDAARETPNLQYHVQPLSLDRFGEPLHPFPAFTASVCNLRPESRGHVRITAPEPSAKPEIRANYLQAEADRQVAVAAIKLTRRIAAAKALARFKPQEIVPGTSYESDADLARAAGDVGTTIFHPVGTARMGTDPEAVVSPRLAVHGLQGLRIADASVMPTITSGNTNSPTLMIAEKAAVMILEDQGA